MSITVKPAEAGAIVRNPDRAMRPLKAEGEAVPRSIYWIRRLNARDVVEVIEGDAVAASATPVAPEEAKDVRPPDAPVAAKPAK